MTTPPWKARFFCARSTIPVWVFALLCVWVLLAAPVGAQNAPALFRDDFNAPFNSQMALDPSKWTAYDGTQKYGRTKFSNTPSIVSENGASFARLPLSTYSGDSEFPFKGTEIFSPLFSLGIGKEMEARVRVTDLAPGLVAAFWAYGSEGTYGTSNFRSDEIDFEFLTKQPRDSLLLTNWNNWDPSRPTYGDGIHHFGLLTSSAGLDWTQWNVYKIRWLPDRTEWYVNGTHVHTMAPAHPDGPLAVRFNVWAPDISFADAHDSSLAPASSAGGAVSYSFDVDWVEVRPITPTLSLGVSPGSWSEAGGSLAVTGVITRNTDFTNPLTVNLSSSGASASFPSQVVIRAGDASALFSIGAIDNQIADGARTVNFAASSGQFVSGTASAVVLDNDVAGVVLAPTVGLGTSESGASTTFSVRLSSEPVAKVRLDLSSSRPEEAIASPATLVFTSQNWSVPQTVTVAGQDDSKADGDQSFSIALAFAGSTDGVYKQLSPKTIDGLNADNDAVGVQVVASPNATTSEAGRSSTFSIRLTSQPSAPVTIGLASSNSLEGTVSPAALTFDALDWSTPKIVTAVGVNDDVADGAQPYQIITQPATSADIAYQNFNAADVSLSNEDDDVVGVLVSPPERLVTTEAGGTATFSVRLNSQPKADVTIPLRSSSEREGAVTSGPLTFSASNWATARTVTISGVDDAVADGDVPFSIVTEAPLSADAAYSAIVGTSISDVQVHNRDNDVVGITITPIVGLVTGEAGQTAELSVALQSQPTADVTVSFSSSNPGEGIVSPARLIFTSGNWNLAQKVTIAGVDDAIADGDQAFAIAAAPSSGDAAYQVLALPVITATNRDNDAPTLSLSLSTATFSEGAGAEAAIGTITRNTSTTTALTVALSSSNLSAARVPASVTIAPGTSSVTFAVQSVDDYAVDGAQSSILSASAGGFSVATVSVTVVDNDVPPVLSLGVASSTWDEHAMSQVNRAALRGRVARDVALPTAQIVRLSSSDASELRVPASVSIAAGQTFVEFVLTPVDDLVADGPRRVTIAARADGYANSPTAIVTVRDNEVPTLSVSIAPGRIAENGAAILMIRRNSEITADTPLLRVSLSATPLGQANVPVLVTIPARASSVSVRVLAVDDILVDGPRLLTITVRATGWASGSGTLVVQDNEASSRLSVSGRVTTSSAQGSLPVGGVTLSLQLLPSNAILDSTLSAPNGSYRFSGLPPGNYRVLAARSGVTFLPASRAATLGASSVGGADFVAALRGQIRGFVLRLNADGTRSSLGNILVTARSGRLSWSVRTDRLGGFLFDRLPLGLFDVAPVLPGTTFSPPARSVRLDTSHAALENVIFTTASAATSASVRTASVPLSPGATYNRETARAAEVPTSPVVLSSAVAQSTTSTVVLRFSGPLGASSTWDTARYMVWINGVAQRVEAASSHTDTVILSLAAGDLQVGDTLECRWLGLLDTQGRTLSGQINLVTR